ncbi:MAG: tRNA (adenosine(37)-N6)-threonylcarbamoyltransferase complex ATPase subunit type 1 TsaE [Clostridia bacterium]|nr:tRNA (adenosine(37)-N6)-threonylcarbamoyltransferase complex ATPase subunit type 1 TsaE [Clostridia bacterium]
MEEVCRLIKEYRCKSLDETKACAKELAASLTGRETIAFFGDLGAGKTTFSRFLCEALGVEDEVTSPTFAMVHEYEGPFPIYHFDMYRVEGEESLFSTGYYDYLGAGLMLIEWSENIESLLPADAWRISLCYGAGEQERIIRIERKDG